MLAAQSIFAAWTVSCTSARVAADGLAGTASDMREPSVKKLKQPPRSAISRHEMARHGIERLVAERGDVLSLGAGAVGLRLAEQDRVDLLDPLGAVQRQDQLPLLRLQRLVEAPTPPSHRHPRLRTRHFPA